MNTRPAGSTLDLLLSPDASLPSALLECLSTWMSPGQERAACWTLLLGLLALRVGAASDAGALEALSAGDVQALRTYWARGAEWIPELLAPSAEAWATSAPVVAGLAALAQTVMPPTLELDAPDDWLAPYFERWIGAKAARKQGEHMTPPLLARQMLQGLDWPQAWETHARDAEGTHDGPWLLDPACGTGVFLVVALALALRSRPEASHVWLSRLEGWDLQPYAVLATRIQLAWFMQQWRHREMRPAPDPADPTTLEAQTPFQARVFRLDALERVLEPSARFGYVVGNPPWVGWETLEREARDRLTLAFQAEGLWVHSRVQMRHGAGKKDLSMLFLARALSEWLAPEGQLSFVLPRSIMTGAPAEGLRRRLEAGPWRPTRVDVFASARLFAATSVPAVVLTLASRPKTLLDPDLPWVRWLGPPGKPETLAEHTVLRWPPQPSGQPWTPELPRTLELPSAPGQDAPCVESAASVLARPGGSSARPRAWEGANTGGANGIFWIDVLEVDDTGRLYIQNLPERGRRPVAQRRGWVEASRVFPLLRGREVWANQAHPDGMILLMQDPVRREGLTQVDFDALPLTKAWLLPFQPVLEARPLFLKFFREQKAPWYSMYNVGSYTLSPWKVVWREQARELTAAAVGPLETCATLPERWRMLGLTSVLHGRPIIPDHKLMLVPCDGEQEARALADWLNSAPVRRVAATLVQGTSAPVRLLDALLARAGASPFCPED